MPNRHDEIFNMCFDFQCDVYDEHGIDSAPIDQTAYSKLVDEIIVKILNAGIRDELDDHLVLTLDDENAHMSAEAVQRILYPDYR